MHNRADAHGEIQAAKPKSLSMNWTCWRTHRLATHLTCPCLAFTLVDCAVGLEDAVHCSSGMAEAYVGANSVLITRGWR